MKQLIISMILGAASVSSLSAGAINIVHLGPEAVLKFEVSAGDDKLDFTLAHSTFSGSFVLPDKATTLKAISEGIPALEIPASQEPRIAVLSPDKQGYKWHLIPAKPTPDKWAFRVYNLSSEPADIIAGEKPVTIPADTESVIDVTRRSMIKLSMGDSIDIETSEGEPCAVIGFLCRNQETWHAVLVPDR